MTGHPNMQSFLYQAAEDLLAGKTPKKSNQYRVTNKVFHHHLVYPAAGQTTTFKFFNVQPDDVVSNWPGNGLAPNQFFRLDKIAIDVEPDGTPSGGYTTVALKDYLTIATASTAATYDLSPALSDTVRKARILKNGNVRFAVQNERLINEYGLMNFPLGVGPEVSGIGGVFGTVTAPAVSSAGFGNVNNGSPNSGNGKWFPGGYPIWPGETIAGEIAFNSALPLGTASRISMFLVGVFLEA